MFHVNLETNNGIIKEYAFQVKIWNFNKIDKQKKNNEIVSQNEVFPLDSSTQYTIKTFKNSVFLQSRQRYYK